MKKALLPAGVLVLIAGQSMSAPPVVDGVLDAGGEYGERLWSNNVGTQFGNNTASSPGSDPNLVNTGFEFKIPLAEIGNPTFPIKIAGILADSGHFQTSNQVFGGLPLGSGSLGITQEIDFSTIAGNQFLTANPAVGAAPVVDGVRDGGAVYTRIFTQANWTSAGNNTTVLSGIRAGGSEIDAVYVARTSTDLYIFVAGNLETNYSDALDIFIDSVPGGQNRIRDDNADLNFNNLNNNIGGDGVTPGNIGLRFDAGFEADYVLMMNGGEDPAKFFADWGNLATAGGGPGGFIGTNLTNGVDPRDNTLDGSNGIIVGLNNDNIAGVGGNPTTSPDFASGSEINNFYAKIDGGRLYIFIGGNLETNDNNLDLFFDVDATTAAEGQNELRSDNVDIDFNNLNRMGIGGNGNPNANPLRGLTFESDAGNPAFDFKADYWLKIKTGGSGPDQFVNSATLRTNGARRFVGGLFDGTMKDYGAFSGGPKSSNNPVPYPATFIDIQDGNRTALYTDMGPRTAEINPSLPVPGLLRGSINNLNAGGVGAFNGSLDLGDAPNVTTGMEFSLDLNELGWDGVSIIRVSGFISSGDHSFLSNQVLGGFTTATGNLGEVTNVDFSTIPGLQLLSICLSDVNRDAVSDLSDFFEFLNRFDLSADNADVNGDYQVDLADFFAFLNAFDAGC